MKVPTASCRCKLSTLVQILKNQKDLNPKP